MAIYILITIAVLIGLKLVAQLFLEQLNRREVLAHSNSVPEPFRAMIEPEAYQKGVEYTLAKSRLTRFELVFDAVLLAVILFSGVLPWLYSGFVGQWGGGALVVSAYLVVVMLLISLPSLPVQWIEQFRLEERFGFNTTTPKLWWTDRLKGLILTLVIGYPLLLLIVKLVDWTGDSWWLWAWALVMAFQLVMLVLAPIVILPLFNKFTPLPEGSLRDRLLELGSRTGFHAKTILVMDGSKRSRHSNAFFTGFGRFRKIILFDTLIEHLDENELEAVLAHEIAEALGAPLIEWHIKSTTRAVQGLYEYDAVARLRDGQLGDERVHDIKNYIKRGKLWDAFTSPPTACPADR